MNTYSIVLKQKLKVRAVFDEIFRAFMPLTCMRGGWKWWLYWKETGFCRMRSKAGNRFTSTFFLSNLLCPIWPAVGGCTSALECFISKVRWRCFQKLQRALLLIRGWRSILVRINSLPVRTDVCLTQHEWSERDPVAFVGEFRKFDVHSRWRQYNADPLRSQTTSKCPQPV